MKNNKKSIVWYITLCFMGQAIQCMSPEMQVNSIQQDNINAARKSVVTEVRNHKLFQIATVSGSIAAGIGGYLLWTRDASPEISSVAAFTGNAGKCFVSEAEQKIIRELIQEKAFKAGKFFYGHNVLSSCVNWFTQQFYLQSYQVAVGVGAAVVFNFLNNGLGPISKYLNRFDGFLDRTVTSIFHKINLEWYVSKHGNLAQIFTMLELYAATLEGRALQIQTNALTNVPITIQGTPQGSLVRDASLKDVVDCWNLYIEHMEMIIGFIEYSSRIKSQTSILEGQRMQSIGKKIQLLTNSFAVSLQQKIQNLETAAILIYDELRELRALIGQELSNFSVLESFKRHDFVAEKS